ncbi:MAG TPA: chloride channel protein [Acidimicrobiales bacterium]|nr:chloride channel protein [Acidimicrobiales bacterium]
MPPRRSPRLLLDAFVGARRGLFPWVLAVGVIGGLVGAAFVGALNLLERGLWPTHTSTTAHLFILAGVGVAVGVLTHVLGTPGDVELLVNNIHVLGGAEDIRDLRSLVPVSLLCISSGGGMGPEAPLVQTTGGLGSWVAARRRASTTETRILTITGMAAGFTVLFGAPLGSAVFALEILHRRGLEYYEALLPAVVGSLSGYVVNVLVANHGITPVWRFPAIGTVHHVDLAWGAACGVAGAAVAVVFTYLARALQWAFRHGGPAARPVAGGLALGALAFWSPYALTFGEAQLNAIAATHAAASTFVTAAVAKLCGTTVTLSSGWRGGFIIPLFFMGAALGRAGHVLVPGANEVVLMAALMAAANCGVTKTPLGSTLVVSEMAGLRLLPPVLIASVVSLLLTSEVALIHSQREREGAFGPPREDPGVSAA